MVEIRSLPESDLEEFRRLHARYVGHDESLEMVRNWYREHPELLVGAYRDGELVGHCLGIPLSETTVELRGIAVAPSHRRRGVGTELLAAFEDRAIALDFRRVSLGSAGGYVDEFYRQNGYAPESILVRLDAEDVPEDYPNAEYEIVDEKREEGTKKLYVGVDDYDPAFVEEVRDAFDDPEAILVMEKHLDSPS